MTYGHLRADCCTPGSAPGPTLGIDYEKPLPFLPNDDELCVFLFTICGWLCSYIFACCFLLCWDFCRYCKIIVHAYAGCMSVYQHHWITDGYSLWSDLGAFSLCCILGCWFHQQPCEWSTEDSAGIRKVAISGTYYIFLGRMITELEFETSIISCINLCMYMHCTKISPKFEFGVRGQRQLSAAFFSGPVLGGPYVRCMYGKTSLA